MRPLVYLAGPDVFLPDAKAVGAAKKRLCEEHGFIGLFPTDDPPAISPSTPPAAAARPDVAIYRSCIAAIRRCDLAIFNLTPFRGISADAGTVFELGLCVGLGKPVFAYSNDGRDLIDRVRASGILLRDAGGGIWTDPAGLLVEDFGNADNLMIDGALDEQGRRLHRGDAEDPSRDLAGFVRCLEDARKAIEASSGA